MFIIYEFRILAYLCLVIKFVLLFVSSSGHLSNRCLLIAPYFGTLGLLRRSWLVRSDAYALSREADIEDLITDRSCIVIRLACAMTDESREQEELPVSSGSGKAHLGK